MSRLSHAVVGVLSLLLAACSSAAQQVQDAAAAHDAACDFAALVDMSPEERAAVDATCAVRCAPPVE